jgi:dolichol kinase
MALSPSSKNAGSGRLVRQRQRWTDGSAWLSFQLRPVITKRLLAGVFLLHLVRKNDAWMPIREYSTVMPSPYLLSPLRRAHPPQIDRGSRTSSRSTIVSKEWALLLPTHGTATRAVALRAGGRDTDRWEKEPSSSAKQPAKSSIVLVTAVSLLTACLLGATTGVLPGYTTPSGANAWLPLWDHAEAAVVGLQSAHLARDVGAMLLTGSLGYAFVQLVSWAVRTGRLAPRDARKIIHTLSAPLFMVLWPLFSPVESARWLAAIVPTLNALRLYLAASNVASESDLAAAVSRSGDAQEAVGGPFIYVCVMAASILLFWRTSPVAIVALSTMAAGDGMADLVGRRFGANNQWPNSNKSVAGTVAFWVSSTLVATGLLAWFQYTGCLVLPFGLAHVAGTVAGITLVSAILELLPWLGDDNYTVPFSAAVLTVLLLHA